MTAIVVLGMHRSGTSCLAGMLAAGGLASAGDAVRNWDNARGHFEMLDAVRLDEAVLAHSGGHWLSPPRELRWTDEHAAARDRLLSARIDDRPALIKDPRTLLVLPFWRASRIPFHAIGIVRHPIAVAHSLESWRNTPIDEGVALWTAHNRALLEDRTHHAYPLIDFDAPRDEMIAAVIEAARSFSAATETIDEAALANAYEDRLVHHDGESQFADRFADALALHALLAASARKGVGPHYRLAARPDLGQASTHPAVSRKGVGPHFGTPDGRAREAYPRAAMEAFARAIEARELDVAIARARQALEAVVDPAVVLVPIVTALVKHRAHPDAPANHRAHSDANPLASDRAHSDAPANDRAHSDANPLASDRAHSDANPLAHESQVSAFDAARSLVEARTLDVGLAELLRGKIALAAGDAAGAVRHLEAACAVEHPFHQARHLLPQALRAVGRQLDARAALERVAGEALYPHGPLATLAEWSWLDGDRDRARMEMQRAIEAAPAHRRGRLRTRLAEWLVAAGDSRAAHDQLERAIAEDPGYQRSRTVLASLARE